MAYSDVLSPDDYWNLGRVASAEGGLADWSDLSREVIELPVFEPVPSGEPVPAVSGGASLVTAGTGYTCAVVDAVAKCWGSNDHGKLGDGTFSRSLLPVEVAGLVGSATAIDAGDNHSCGAAGNGVWCWGMNNVGQLGVAGATDREVPVAVSNLSGPVTAVAAGGSHSCAVTVSGVLCWGGDGWGQLGDDIGDDTGFIPRPAIDLTGGVRAIAAGRGRYADRGHTCAISGAGVLYCWGDNSAGQVGINQSNVDKVEWPAQVPYVGAVQAVDAGAEHTCALTESGGVKCWGRNAQGQLGAGITDWNSIKARDVVGLGSGVRAVATGGSQSCAVKDDGSVLCWGSNSNGQLGIINSTQSMSVPVAVDGVSGAVQIAAGDRHTCALLGNGGISCWGANTNGQLGDGTQQSRYQPARVVQLLHSVSGQVRDTGGNPVGGVKVEAGGNLSVTTGVDGSFVFSDLVSSTYTITPSKPGYTFTPPSQTFAVPPSARAQIFTATVDLEANPLTAGAEHTCAVVYSGARCWGAGDFGRLGNGTAAFGTRCSWLRRTDDVTSASTTPAVRRS